jgi:phosphate transport system protein
MSVHLQRDLERLKHDLLGQSSLVEQMVMQACAALGELSTQSFDDVQRSEDRVNEAEVRIEEEALKILALHQPVAVDLRRVATILKINSDLERIADLAVNICERTRSLVQYPEFRAPADLRQMTAEAISMVRDALNAFVRLDVGAARDVCLRDDVLDDLNRSVIDDLVQLMQQQPASVSAALHFYSASRHIERIGDHATNIAEDVIYLVEGEIARHRLD